VKDILAPEGTWKNTPLDNGKRAPATLARAQRAMDTLGRGTPFLIVYYGSDGSGGWQPLDRPIRTLTTLDRFGLVTWSGHTPMLRMLQVPELRKAMGFDQTFILDKGSRRDNIRLLGNGVCPPVMEAIVRTLVGVESSVKTAPEGYPRRDANALLPVVPPKCSLARARFLATPEIHDDFQMSTGLKQALEVVRIQAKIQKMSADEITAMVRKLSRTLQTPHETAFSSPDLPISQVEEGEKGYRPIQKFRG
jgi:hypothetical protein